MKVKNFLKDVTGASRVTKARLQAFENASAVPVARDPIREAVQERHPDMTEMVVTEIRPASPTSKTIRFSRTDGKKMPIFYAGQYVSIALPIGSPIENSAGSSGNGPDHVPNVTGRIVCRPYSISSAPYEARAEEEPFIEITVRNSGKDGFAAEYLCHGLKAGDHLLGSIGHGQFYYEPLRDSKKIVALAGGAGITPFASMAKEIAHGTMDAELTLLYGSVSADDIVLKEELEQIDCPRVKIVHVLSGDNPGWEGEKGFLNAELIRRYAPEDASFFICGPQAMYRFCDRLGIYVIDETNLETHGTWDAYVRGVRGADFVLPGDHAEWHDLVLDRAASMFERDKNHPCILIWSCGNESYGGRNLYDISQYFRDSDDTRLVHYEGICHDRSYPDTSDMESRMYPSVREIRAFLSEHRDKPFICCEYTHAMGNSCGAMKKYTDLTEEDPLYQGGFIWDYIDQTLTKKDRYGHEYEAYGGDFGERPTDWDFSANGIVFGGDGRKPTPKMQSVRYNYQPFGIRIDAEKAEAVIRNRLLFTDASAFDMFYTAERFGTELFRVPLSVAAAPGESVVISLEGDGIPSVPDGGETVLRISVCLKEQTPYAAAGYEVAFGEAVKGSFDGPEAESGGCGGHKGTETGAETEPVGTESDRPLFEVCEGTCNWGVRGDGFEVLFSLLSGGMISYRIHGRELLEGAVRPNFWRAPTQNDIGNGMPQRYAQWKIASEYASWKREMTAGFDHVMPPAVPKTEKTEDSFRITFPYLLPTSPAAEARLTHEVFANGTVKTTLTYRPVPGLPAMPEFGVMLKMNADFGRLTWYGYGPEETYPDRMEGAKLGIYEGAVTDQPVPYVMPQESGAHACTRYAAVTDADGHGLLFVCDPRNRNPYKGGDSVMYSGMTFSALPYTPAELEGASHAYELPPVHHTVVRVSAGQMGIGGDDTWGALTHPEYLLDASGRMRFTFYMKGL